MRGQVLVGGAVAGEQRRRAAASRSARRRGRARRRAPRAGRTPAPPRGRRASPPAPSRRAPFFGSSTLRMPKAIDATSKARVGVGQRACTSATSKRTSSPAACAFCGAVSSIVRAEVGAQHLAGGAHRALEGQREVAGAGGAVEHPVAGLHAREPHRRRAATAGGCRSDEHVVGRVVPRRDARRTSGGLRAHREPPAAASGSAARPAAGPTAREQRRAGVRIRPCESLGGERLLAVAQRVSGSGAPRPAAPSAPAAAAASAIGITSDALPGGVRGVDDHRQAACCSFT